ncbi:MAG TPA: 3-hydroxyacyl-CoA dehydrogenase NAD-binding domain-containing protein [Cytophagaceae bacterium]|jgi:3-hydroxybutyryl-CoA dehydrogenase|nr:3-hydroxyacyl-CoA dehydrogenase NAD-binding domain-containing protein [Cytophagaceae bacterium]
MSLTTNSQQPPTNVSVIGSGTMGNGIAHVFALSGYQVSLFDISEEALSKALKTISGNLDRQVSKAFITEEDKNKTLASIKTFTNLSEAVANAQLVVEAATEDKIIKLGIFKKLDEFSPAGCILSSNTSSIPIHEIAEVTNRKDKVIGMHFMNPVPVMKLVEIVKAKDTSAEVCATIKQITESLGKIPVLVNDAPGFISNRILMPMINEAVYALQEGVGGVAEIDEIMKLGMAHPMGPLKLADLIGIDVCVFILNVLYEGFNKNPKYAPCPLLVEMLNAGEKGIKSGNGFYHYSNGGKESAVAERFGK